MNTTVSTNKVFVVTKNDVKKFVKQQIRKDSPSKIDQITNRMFLESIVYLQGYIDAIQQEMQPPINKQELTVFLLDKAYKFIYKQL